MVPFQELPRDTATVELSIRATLHTGETSEQTLATIQVTSDPTIHAGQPPARVSCTEKPVVGICMTTYNPPLDLFARQIGSIQAQTYSEWVCVISDDCSETGRLERMREIIAGDSRFSLFSTSENLGFYRNFERALSILPGDVDFVALADQDDRWHPEKLETLIAQFDSRTTLVYSDMNIVDADGSVRSATYWTTRRNNYTNLASLLFANTVTGAAAVFRRSLLEYVLPFPDKVGDSYHDHWIACAALALGEIRYVDRPLYDYVQHGQNAIGHYAKRHDKVEQLFRLARWVLPPRSTEAWHQLLSDGRAIYHHHVLRICQFAKILDLRCGERMDPAKRNAVRRVASIETRRGAFWLFRRGLGDMLRPRSVTLGAEFRLLHAALWRWKLDSVALPALHPRATEPRSDASAAVKTVIDVSRMDQVAFIIKKIAPLRLRVRRTVRRVNLVIGIIDFKYVFGGYLTVFHLARRLSDEGFNVRLVIVDECDFQPEIWAEQFRAYEGLEGFLDNVEVVYAHDRTVPIDISAEDTFVATSWWTAHVAHKAVTTLGKSKFVYLSQDYEPIFYPMGPFAALANESYALPHYAVFSTELLRDYFRRNRLGVFASGNRTGDHDSVAFRNAITAVQPASPQEMARRRTRKLLFYARPESHAARNLFEIAVLGLCKAVDEGCFDRSWEFNGIGSLGTTRTLKLTKGRVMELLPRTTLSEYRTILSSHDVGISLMYSPHPSLVPIEMASAGMLTVTNRFLNKTADELHAISSNFVVCDATIAAVARGLSDAVNRVDRYDQRVAGARVNWSRTWGEAFDAGFMRRIVEFLHKSSR
jgi:glycosyltransferase involved in cell wall biosynthesis